MSSRKLALCGLLTALAVVVMILALVATMLVPYA